MPRRPCCAVMACAPSSTAPCTNHCGYGSLPPCAARGVDCSPDQVFITNGAQQGLTILSRLFLDPGAPAVIEAVTFTGIQQVTAGRGAVVRTVPTDLTTGVDVDALEAAFRREPKPRLAVIIPDFHNPLGVSLTIEKRIRIAELAARYGVPVIEDDPYSSLRFEGRQLRRSRPSTRPASSSTWDPSPRCWRRRPGWAGSWRPPR